MLFTDSPRFHLLYHPLFLYDIILFIVLDLCSRCPRTNHNSRRLVPWNSVEIFTQFGLRLPGFVATCLVILKHFAAKNQTYFTSKCLAFRTEMFPILIRIYNLTPWFSYLCCSHSYLETVIIHFSPYVKISIALLHHFTL